MKTSLALILMIAMLGCSTRPCVDGERSSGAGAWGFGAVETSYRPCKQRCCAPDWTRGCACTKRCPCWERHSK